MTASTLDRSIVIQRFEETGQNAHGESEGSWVRTHPNATLAARIMPMKGTERVARQQTVGKNAVTLRIRFRANVLSTDRVLYDGLTWDIRGTSPVGRRKWLDIDCESRSDV